jgi:hypothetical protein
MHNHLVEPGVEGRKVTSQAETLLLHTIKVQFPNLHEQFRNIKALTIMASKIGEVLEIEPEDSYIKRPVGPTIMVET